MSAMFLWIGFIVLVLLLLALDLGVFHRRSHVVRVREALMLSAFWIALALAFIVFIYFAYENHWAGLGLRPDVIDGVPNNGHRAAVKYFTGYVLEKSLSVDNIFVIALVFSYFGVAAKYQHRVLYWGILGALMMRGAMIGGGSLLIARFHWVLYLLGAFLILTALKMVFSKDEPDPTNNAAVRLARRIFPITPEFHDRHFLVKVGGRHMLTPLALALIVVETTDLIFAVDSIPAIFAITGDPFLVFTSNVFAILGLRALYFALAGIMDKFYYLKLSLAVILALVGAKMLLADWLKHAFGPSIMFYLLGLIALILAIGVVASIIRARHLPPHEEEVPASESADHEVA